MRHEEGICSFMLKSHNVLHSLAVKHDDGHLSLFEALMLDRTCRWKAEQRAEEACTIFQKL